MELPVSKMDQYMKIKKHNKLMKQTAFKEIITMEMMKNMKNVKDNKNFTEKKESAHI